MQVEQPLSGTPVRRVTPIPPALPSSPASRVLQRKFYREKCSSSCLYKHSALLSLPELSAGLPQGICEIHPAVICNNIGIKLASLSCRGVSV